MFKELSGVIFFVHQVLQIVIFKIICTDSTETEFSNLRYAGWNHSFHKKDSFH